MAAIGFRFSDEDLRILNQRAAEMYLPEIHLRSGDFWHYCSGTLIGTHTVVVAGHCVDPNLNPFFNPNNLEKTLDRRLEDFSFVQLGGNFYATSAVFLHPDYMLRDVPVPQELIDQCGRICVEIIQLEDEIYGSPVYLTRNDIAVFTLADDVPGIVPFSLTRTEPRIGSRIVIVGYGVTNNPGAGRPDGSEAGASLAGVNFISAYDQNRVYFFFDHENESDTCVGDSGGPLFTNYGAGAVLVGVTSGGTSSRCGLGDVAWNERVDIHVDWINEVSGGNVFQVLD